MNYFYSKNTPLERLNPLKHIILLNIALSLFCALFDILFPHWNLPSPHNLFSLSLWGIKHYFFWQFFTNFFISPVADGLTLSFILSLFLNMYFLWMVGSSVIEKRSVKHFLCLYFGGGLFSSFIAACILFHTNAVIPVSGINPPLYALLTASMMLLPEVQILLFFTIPIKIKWLIVGILSINLFIDLSHGHFLHFFLYLSSIGFGYFYALLVWKIYSPFKGLFFFEKFLITSCQKLRKKNTSSTRSFHTTGKIYDFRTGKLLLSEEEFLDSCLSKIAIQGKNSLTLLERWKMRKISKKKKRRSS